MAHPMHEHRQHKVEHARVHKLTHGMARHPDVKEDVALVKKMVKPGALKMHGKKGKARLDKYARGGGVKGKGKTQVNINIQTGEKPPMAGIMPRPVAPPMGPPPMPPQMAAGAPPVPPPMANAAPMVRAHGGRAFKRGGAVKTGPAWKEGLRNGTKPQNTPGKNDTKDIYRGKQITYKKGGRVEAPEKASAYPQLKRAGAESGEGRLEKIGLQRRA